MKRKVRNQFAQRTSSWSRSQYTVYNAYFNLALRDMLIARAVCSCCYRHPRRCRILFSRPSALVCSDDCLRTALLATPDPREHISCSSTCSRTHVSLISHNVQSKPYSIYQSNTISMADNRKMYSRSLRSSPLTSKSLQEHRTQDQPDFLLRYS
jgi:hypothetical protein